MNKVISILKTIKLIFYSWLYRCFRPKRITKLSINSIIKWEQITGKPFSHLNYSNEDDVITLFYVCGQINTTLQEYKTRIKEKDLQKQIQDFENHTSIYVQFQNKFSRPKKNNKKEHTVNDIQPIYIKDIVPALILEGLDANYALREMNLCDLPIFIDALENAKKEKLEAQRLWTFLIMSPHLTKKTKSPKDIFPFPWELDEIKAEAIQNIEKNKDLLSKFLNGELIDLDKMNWGKK